MPVVFAPLPHITVHVTKAIGIGPFKVVDRGCFLPVFASGTRAIGSIVFISTVIVGVVGREGRTKVKGSSSTRPAGVFPFGFAGETVLAVGVTGEAIAKLHGVMPRDLFYRSAIAFEAGWIGF
jgi:hypothetical protein